MFTYETRWYKSLLLFKECADILCSQGVVEDSDLVKASVKAATGMSGAETDLDFRSIRDDPINFRDRYGSINRTIKIVGEGLAIERYRRMESVSVLSCGISGR